MTVGIILNNEHSGVAIADSRITSNNQRQSDSANKLTTIVENSYEGAILGAGDASMIFSLLKHAKRARNETLEGFLADIKNTWFNIIEETRLQIIEFQSKVSRNETDAMGEGMPLQFNPENDITPPPEPFDMSECMTIFYDRKEQRIKKHRIFPEAYMEDHIFESVIGSGSDAAGLEFLRLMPGTSIKSLGHREIAFFGMCAYVKATQNIGVGGMPKIALIDKMGVTKISKEAAVSMANIIGAYTSELITRDYAELHFGEVMTGLVDYANIEKHIGLPKFALENLLVPLESWIGYANRKRYRKNPYPAPPEKGI